MTRRYYIETLPNGQRQLVYCRSRSRSRGGHDRPHGRTLKVTREAWWRNRDGGRGLDDTAFRLRDEIPSLTADRATVGAENKGMRQTIPRLEGQVSLLAAENEGLRQSLRSAGKESFRGQEVARLQSRIKGLEGENGQLRDDNSDLRARIKGLSRLVDDNLSRRVEELRRDVQQCRDQCLSWRLSYDHLRRSYDRVAEMLEARRERLRAYEDILRRNGFIRPVER